MLASLRVAIACAILLLELTSAWGDATGGKILGRVVRVFDGDSFVLMQGSRKVEVRVFGIDAPEKGQPWSDRARSFATDKLLGERVTIVVRTARDSHGRVVGEVLLPGGRNLAQELVRAGFAWQYTRYSNDATVAKLEAEARRMRRGLWIDPKPEAPWRFRQRQGKKPQRSKSSFRRTAPGSAPLCTPLRIKIFPFTIVAS